MSDKQQWNAPAPGEGDRFVGGIGEPVRNRDLLCIRCVHLGEDAASECEIYVQKPLPVLRGRDHCPDFTPQNGSE